ncbi:MAG: hypothetical protein DMG14_20710, partial [Acidobacteria bacterium]
MLCPPCEWPQAGRANFVRPRRLKPAPTVASVPFIVQSRADGGIAIIASRNVSEHDADDPRVDIDTAPFLPIECVSIRLKPHFVGLDATFVLLKSRTNQFIRYNAARADQRFAPCSTFNIPHTAILLETGTATDADYKVQYDPAYKQPSQWAQDFTLAGAFKASALWYYQVLARRAGMPVEQRFVRQFKYGNEDTRGGLSEMGRPFWVDGTLRISAN